MTFSNGAQCSKQKLCTAHLMCIQQPLYTFSVSAEPCTHALLPPTFVHLLCVSHPLYICSMSAKLCTFSLCLAPFVPLLCVYQHLYRHALCLPTSVSLLYFQSIFVHLLCVFQSLYTVSVSVQL
ncbi:hypothetical protein CEXT_424821 [Caerostris extrusa]|uniref:Uncharacterized protein n=1 Tax=Caerostris extrusa TaxID=172846 RepID=A0AAV4W909_CAEEX|nr:hypothetical protein CEXT_424821 [Caerostris extrusa]